jgi:hypothetical protein
MLGVRSESKLQRLEKRMKLRVLSYNEVGDCHLCRDERGEVLRVDLMVCGTLPEDTTPQSLVGKVVTCESVHTFIFLAEGVAIDSDVQNQVRR